MKDSHGLIALLQPAGLIHDPRHQRLQDWSHFLPDRPPHGLLIPWAVRDELLAIALPELLIPVHAPMHG